MLVDSTWSHGPRSIKRITELFGPLADPLVVKTSDLDRRYDPELSLHLKNYNHAWRNDVQTIVVE